MRKIYSLFLILFSFVSYSAQATGIFESYAVLKINGGGNTYYDLQATTGNPDLNGANLGTFTAGQTLVFVGGENKTWKNGGGDVTGGRIHYRVYTGTPSGSFANVDFKIEENSTVTNLGNTDISFSPNIIANAVIQYKPIKNLQLNLNNQYIGKQYLDNTETQSLQLNDYFLTDFNAQYEFKIAKQEVSLQFLLNNIFDKKYVNNGFVYDGPYYYAQAGRNFMIGLSFKIK